MIREACTEEKPEKQALRVRRELAMGEEYKQQERGNRRGEQATGEEKSNRGEQATGGEQKENMQ